MSRSTEIWAMSWSGTKETCDHTAWNKDSSFMSLIFDLAYESLWRFLQYVHRLRWTNGMFPLLWILFCSWHTQRVLSQICEMCSSIHCVVYLSEVRDKYTTCVLAFLKYGSTESAAPMQHWQIQHRCMRMPYRTRTGWHDTGMRCNRTECRVKLNLIIISPTADPIVFVSYSQVEMFSFGCPQWL